MSTLITGGIKSGKSAYALELSHKFGKCAFIATADPNDSSMKLKIENHRRERVNLSLTTYEETLDLPGTLSRLQSVHDAVIIDCLTMWVSNLMFLIPEKQERQNILEKFIEIGKSSIIPCIIITNEVGLGIIPENKVAREYGEELGILNKRMAQHVNNVVLMVSGIPVKIK